MDRVPEETLPAPALRRTGLALRLLLAAATLATRAAFWAFARAKTLVARGTDRGVVPVIGDADGRAAVRDRPMPLGCDTAVVVAETR